MRNTKLIVYGSSYDRGLEHLLKMWADIKKAVPEAQLRIFYGWNLFDVVAKGNPQMQDWKQRMVKLMAQDGITELGRISHEAVKVEYENAGIWAYPAHFGEISCISAMKAQVYGAIPVVVSYAALQETVQHGIKVDGDIYEPETRDEFKAKLIELLKDDKAQEKIRKPMMEWAKKKFAWSNVAKQWSNDFKSSPSIERQVAELMDDNQALKAWELVKDTSLPIKDRVWLRVRHAFEPDTYREYYEKHLVEYPVSEELSTNAQVMYPRMAWAVEKMKAQKPNSVVDLGCADGYLPLTLAAHGIKGVGVNLHNPSVEIANKRAKEKKLNAEFIHSDLFDYKDKHDAVVMMEVLEHLPDPQKGVDHAMSLLNKDGVAYFSTPRTDHVGVEQHKANPNKGSWDDGLPSGHLRLMSEAEFKDLFKNYKITDYLLDGERCMCVAVKHV